MEDCKIDYSQFAIPKPTSKRYKTKRVEDTPKKQKGLKQKTRLKSKSKPIPKEVKEAVLKEKGGLCFSGYCVSCGGTTLVDINDDFHHMPFRSHGGKDCIEHLWACKRECHDFMHDHPLMAKEMFKEMEKDGIPVVWKIDIKQSRAAPEKR